MALRVRVKSSGIYCSWRSGEVIVPYTQEGLSGRVGPRPRVVDRVQQVTVRATVSYCLPKQSHFLNIGVRVRVDVR